MTLMMTGRFPIQEITPTRECGEHPAKAVVGELVPVGAVSYREGHDALGCNVVWQGPNGQARPFTRMTPGDSDHWHTTIRPDAVGTWTFVVEAFSDPYLTWRDSVTKKMDAGQGSRDLVNDLAIGADVLDRAKLPAEHAPELAEAIVALRDHTLPLGERVFPALDLADIMWQHPVRDLATTGPTRRIWVNRQRALYSAWYEVFPRSEGAVVDALCRPIKHGTFDTAAERLPAVAEMGFHVVYLPPVHPIGRINRKARTTALAARRLDVASPWAIGSVDGGHYAL